MSDLEQSGSTSPATISIPRASLRIDGELNIYTVSDHRERLLAAIDHSDRLDVDLAGITDIDTAGLQLLIALEAEARHRGLPLSFRSPSQAVLDVLELSRLRPSVENGFLPAQRETATETQ